MMLTGSFGSILSRCWRMERKGISWGFKNCGNISHIYGSSLRPRLIPEAYLAPGCRRCKRRRGEKTGQRRGDRSSGHYCQLNTDRTQDHKGLREQDQQSSSSRQKGLNQHLRPKAQKIVAATLIAQQLFLCQSQRKAFMISTYLSCSCDKCS